MPKAAYQKRLEQAQAELTRLDRLSALIANARAVSFLAVLGFLGASLYGRLPPWGYSAAGVGFVLYVLLLWRHDRVFGAEARARVRIELNERGLCRLDGRWHTFSSKGERYLDPAHLYTPDLDVFGQGSLFQLLDETGTRSGEARLASWLTAPAGVQEVAARQEAVRELSMLLDFRQAVITEGRLAAKQKADPSRLIAWAEGESLLAPIRWARPLAFVLPALALGLYLAGLEPWYWLVLLAQLGVVALTRKRLAAFYEQLAGGEGGFVRYERTFQAIEAQPFTAARLRELGVGTGEDRASVRLARFSRLFSFAQLRQSGQLHAVLNLALLWDLHWLFLLEGWRLTHGPKLRGLFSSLADLEAICALAGFAHDRPGYSYPRLLEGAPRFVAKGLGHPLLERPVPNDVALGDGENSLLVTGSNMSGKTTLLRAMGLSAIMAQCGLPVCAELLELTPLQPLTSMRVKDSLERGVSYFYAEVQRAKAVLDAAKSGRGLFLLDELLLGTNTRERQIASRELLRLLLATGSIGAVTTHDLSLAELAGQPGFSLRNVHFSDQIVEGRMSFDYRLQEGVVDTTNALRVLRQAGIPLPEGE